MSKKAVWVAVLALGIPGLILALAYRASAHHTNVSGVAECDETTGTFTVVWTISNSEKDLPMIYSSRLGEGGIGAGGSDSKTEVGLPAGSYSLTVNGEWTRNGKVITASNTGSVSASGPCEKETPPTTEPPTETPTTEPPTETPTDIPEPSEEPTTAPPVEGDNNPPPPVEETNCSRDKCTKTTFDKNGNVVHEKTKVYVEDDEELREEGL